MEETKTIITVEELDKLKDLQNKLNDIISTLGQIEIQFKDLQDTKTQTLLTLNSVRAEQNSLGEILNKKYGNGVIDIETGTFTLKDNV